MLTIKRIAAVLMLLLVLGLGAPRAFADPGDTPTPPGQVETPPCGETLTPPGQTEAPPGDIMTPPSSAQAFGGLSAWSILQMLANGWGVR